MLTEQGAIGSTVAALSAIRPGQFHLKELAQTLTGLDTVISANTPKMLEIPAGLLSGFYLLAVTK